MALRTNSSSVYYESDKTYYNDEERRKNYVIISKLDKLYTKIIDELTFEYKKNLIFISDYTYEQKKNYCDIIIEKELKKQLTEFTDNNCTNLNISIYEAFNDDITFIRAMELIKEFTSNTEKEIAAKMAYKTIREGYITPERIFNCLERKFNITNRRILCECGRKVIDIKKHLQTNIHKRWIEEQLLFK